MPAAPSHTESLAIAQGQTLQIHAQQGDVLVVEAGRATLEEAPCWLADTVFRPPVTLSTGDAHRVVRTGWVTVVAATTAILRQHPATHGLPHRTPFLQRLLGLLSPSHGATFARPPSSIFHAKE